jgi:hypothetical protein
MAALPKANYMLDAHLTQIKMAFFIEIEKIKSTVYMEALRPKVANTIQSKKRNVGGITIPEFQLYYEAIVIQLWFLHQNRCEDLWNR